MFVNAKLVQLVCSALVCGVFVFAGLAMPTETKAQTDLSAGTLQAASSTEISALSPQFVVVPKISAASAVEQVGQTEAGRMETPENWRNVGWYQPGIKPGQQGHAVFAAHRDWGGNAGPFYDLPKLSVGDNVFIVGKEAIHVYTVTSSRDYARTADPESAIFGSKDKPKITLITCEGDFVDSAGTYNQRRVVQAELAYTFQ
jgi:LPXTG-site transpeptidase (sortase) family protein